MTANSQRRKLPIGIQTFAKIRGDDYYYVDKTALALRLIESGSHYFVVPEIFIRAQVVRASCLA
jgi:hypothetical protein